MVRYTGKWDYVRVRDERVLTGVMARRERDGSEDDIRGRGQRVEIVLFCILERSVGPIIEVETDDETEENDEKEDTCGLDSVEREECLSRELVPLYHSEEGSFLLTGNLGTLLYTAPEVQASNKRGRSLYNHKVRNSFCFRLPHLFLFLTPPPPQLFILLLYLPTSSYYLSSSSSTSSYSSYPHA